MRLVHYLQETTIGRALVAYFVDLPRWVLPLFVMVIVVLAYAVWVVWTQ